MATGYSIDSRTVAPGELFFAVRGERLDGHDYVAAAFERGAVARSFLAHKVATLPDAALAVPLLLLKTPSSPCRPSHAHVRRQWGKRVVAITGSAGKTTTKEAIAAALSAKFNVLKSMGNLNNAFGLPLQLLRFEPEHEYAVIEMGMNHLGEIAALAASPRPIGASSPTSAPRTSKTSPRARPESPAPKYELVAALPANGVAFLNCSDPYVSQFGRDFHGKVVYFGVGPCADPPIRESKEDPDRLHVHYRAGEHDGRFILHLLGSHNAQNAMAGLAVAIEAGVASNTPSLPLRPSRPATSAAKSSRLPAPPSLTTATTPIPKRCAP